MQSLMEHDIFFFLFFISFELIILAILNLLIYYLFIEKVLFEKVYIIHSSSQKFTLFFSYFSMR